MSVKVSKAEATRRGKYNAYAAIARPGGDRRFFYVSRADYERLKSWRATSELLPPASDAEADPANDHAGCCSPEPEMFE